MKSGMGGPPFRSGARAQRARLALAWILPLLAWGACAAEPPSYRGRPVYSEPASGLQLPPGCDVDPSWRMPVAGADLEVWIAHCEGTQRVWLLRRQVLEVLNSHQSRLRFQILDERVYFEEDAGDTMSVQCSGTRDDTGYAVVGARWRAEGRQLRLRTARAALRADPGSTMLVDADLSTVDCIRFPDREAMMRRLRQGH